MRGLLLRGGGRLGDIRKIGTGVVARAAEPQGGASWLRHGGDEVALAIAGMVAMVGRQWQMCLPCRLPMAVDGLPDGGLQYVLALNALKPAMGWSLQGQQ